MSGVVFYGIYAGLGLGGILIAKTLLGLLAVAIAAWTSRRSEHLPTATLIAMLQVGGLYADGPCTLLVFEPMPHIKHAMVFPVRSVAAAAELKLKGNLAVPFNCGEYATWHLPDCRCSMDGRYETVYPDSTVQLGEDFFAGRSRKLLDDYPTDHVLAPAVSPVNEMLARDPAWRVLETDDVSTLWTRR